MTYRLTRMSVSRYVIAFRAVLVFLCAGPIMSLPAHSAQPETEGFRGWSWVGPKKKWSYKTTDSGQGPVQVGKTADRFEIRAGDCGKTGDYNDCKHDREHVAWNETGSTKLGTPVWYSLSVFIPASTPTKLQGDVNVILAEWRPVGPGQINLSIELQKDGLVAVVGSTTKKQKNDMKPPKPALWRSIDSQAPTDKWINFELEVMWSTGKDGQLVLYRDKMAVASLRGPNTVFNKPVHMQYGIYRPFVSKAGGPLPTQIIYFDNVKKASTREQLIPENN